MRTQRDKPPHAHEPRLRARRRYHLGIPGAIYIFLTLLVALGAFNSQNNLLFWAFGFSLALLVVSGFLSGAMLMGIQARRLPIGESTAGERMPVHYKILNRNRRIPAFALTITEVDPGPRTRRRARAHPHAQSWTSFTSEPRAFVAHVGPGQTVHGEAVALPTRRGTPRFSHFLISTSFPFGIIKKSLLFEQPTDAIIRPAPLPVAPSILLRSPRQAGRGTSPTRRAGPGDEFFALREYVPGDSPRAIAWRASARTQELLVRQSAAPAPVRVRVMLRFTPGATDAMHERAIGLAAGLLDAAIARALDIGLDVPAMGISIFPRDGRLQRERLMNELALIDLSRLNGAGPAPPVGPDPRTGPGGARTHVVCVVVHSGAVDTTGSLPGALHLSGLDAPELAPGGDAHPVRRARPPTHSSQAGRTFAPEEAAP